MSERPWERSIGVLMYGSMLQHERLEELFGPVEDHCVPVDVEGIARVFDATADRRETDGAKRAVLNAYRRDGASINAVLVRDIDPGAFGRYVHRETGYRFPLLDRADVRPRQGDTGLPDEIVIALDAPSADGIEPIPSYLETCLEAARSWGSRFYEDFIATTELADGRGLDTFLADRD